MAPSPRTTAEPAMKTCYIPHKLKPEGTILVRMDAYGNILFVTSRFRPVGLVFDAHGRLYVSSDATGEIFRVRYTNANSTRSGGSSASGASHNPLSRSVYAFIIVLFIISL